MTRAVIQIGDNWLSAVFPSARGGTSDDLALSLPKLSFTCAAVCSRRSGDGCGYAGWLAGNLGQSSISPEICCLCKLAAQCDGAPDDPLHLFVFGRRPFGPRPEGGARRQNHDQHPISVSHFENNQSPEPCPIHFFCCFRL